ncbi:hypothetical protein [Halalkalibacterium halodurans]|uniref:hypothetical protein n=1 Tax=Halalkalibacterium halodurans TaxID=86665 RepID=UPI002AAA3EE5|nr:hypothetical protein [Halalkalibacterium halodurans]MDY7224614.1 hypothetical protein [Halalkalibacterium halodurans]MDY7240737.1 hypothetical protein [Halalkalibacterium halodurans]
MKLIPIYTEIVKDRQNHTIFLDEKTRFTYKAYHKEPSQRFYWIGFFSFLFFMREMQQLNLSFSNTVNIGLIIAVIVLGLISGKYFYKKFTYEEIKEIYLTESMIEDYVEEGERVFKLELWIAAICLISFLFLIILFIFTSSFVLLIFSYLALVFFKVYLYRLPKERFRLYKRSTN